MGLDGGKMLLRIDDTDPGSNQTMVACADAVGALAAERLVAMVELSRRRDGWEGQGGGRPRSARRGGGRGIGPRPGFGLHMAQAPGTGRAGTGAGSDQPACLLLGGDPGERSEELMASWEAAMALPQVRGLVGRSLLYPPTGMSPPSSTGRWLWSGEEVRADLFHPPAP